MTTINDLAKKLNTTPANLRRKLRAMPKKELGVTHKKGQRWNEVPSTLAKKLAA